MLLGGLGRVVAHVFSVLQPAAPSDAANLAPKTRRPRRPLGRIDRATCGMCGWVALGQNHEVTDFERMASELAASIRLGYESEQEDPNFVFDVPSQDEISWLGSWLASEGWSRSPDWSKG